MHLLQMAYVIDEKKVQRLLSLIKLRQYLIDIDILAYSYPPTMLLEFQTPFVEVANLHHEIPTDMPSILPAFSFHDIHI